METEVMYWKEYYVVEYIHSFIFIRYYSLSMEGWRWTLNVAMRNEIQDRWCWGNMTGASRTILMVSITHHTVPPLVHKTACSPAQCHERGHGRGGSRSLAGHVLIQVYKSHLVGGHWALEPKKKILQ